MTAVLQFYHHKVKTETGVAEPINPNLERMYNEGIEKKNRLARALKEKERLEK